MQMNFGGLQNLIGEAMEMTTRGLRELKAIFIQTDQILRERQEAPWQNTVFTEMKRNETKRMKNNKTLAVTTAVKVLFD